MGYGCCVGSGQGSSGGSGPDLVVAPGVGESGNSVGVGVGGGSVGVAEGGAIVGSGVSDTEASGVLSRLSLAFSVGVSVISQGVDVAGKTGLSVGVSNVVGLKGTLTSGTAVGASVGNSSSAGRFSEQEMISAVARISR